MNQIVHSLLHSRNIYELEAELTLLTEQFIVRKVLKIFALRAALRAASGIISTILDTCLISLNLIVLCKYTI
jgi:hypothetical protein